MVRLRSIVTVLALVGALWSCAFASDQAARRQTLEHYGSGRTLAPAGGDSAEVQAFFARLSSEPTTERKAAYRALINTLVSAGVWSKLDVLHLLAAADQATAFTNLVSADYTATKDADAPFTIDRGLTGIDVAASTLGLDTHFNPTEAGGHYAQNSATVCAWSDYVVGQSRALVFAGDPFVAWDKLVMYPYQNNGLGLNLINANSESGFNQTTDGGGLQCLTRTGSAGWAVHQRGLNRGTQTRASVGIPDIDIRFIGSGFAGHVMATVIGGGLSDAEHLALSNAIEAYLDEVGAPTTTAAERLSPASITQREVWIPESGPIETTLINHDGVLKTISFEHGGSITVRAYPSGTELASKAWSGGTIVGNVIYGSALVAGGAIHIFGTTNTNTRIVHSVLDASYNPSTAETVYEDLGALLANTSVVSTGSAYVMSIERYSGTPTVHFLETSDFETWETFGEDFTSPDTYIGSPKLVYTGGTFYLAYLTHPKTAYFMKVARSTDGTDWENADTDNSAVLLYPEFRYGISASDLTMVEYGGNVEGVFLAGDQGSNTELWRVRYSGVTFAQLLSAFF